MVSNSIATITIDNPPVNVMDANVYEQLSHAVDEIKANAAVKAVILTGAGEKVFVAFTSFLKNVIKIGNGITENRQIAQI